jgi:hypothetical protein
MAQTGYTPIQIYYSTTTTNAPSAGNLLSGELAINITDGKMFYKDNGGSVQVIAWKTTPTTAGGTGLTSWTAGDLPYYSTGTTLTKLGIGTNGQVLTSTGTAPQWSTLSGVAVTTFSAGTTGFTPSTATSGAVTLAGTLATTNGGTGLTSFTANRVFYSSSTSAIGSSANLTFDGTTLTANALTTTSTVTINGGTANGVAYLNGSKVLTTGSALTFDGTNLGLGTASPGTGGTSAKWITLDANSGSAYSGGVIYRVNGTAQAFHYVDGTAFAHQTQTGITAQKFLLEGTEQMRLTSTGLGIGTSSPASKLHINTGGNTTAGGITLQNAGNQQHFWYLSTNTTSTFEIGSSSGQWTWVNSGGTRLTLDASGNLGLGVTPSAWQSPFVAFQISTGGAALTGRTDGGQVNLSSNWRYGSGTNLYINNGFASRYAQESGGHYWYTAPSGTAGNAISFTQAMTLNASGELLVGTTSASSLSSVGRGLIEVNGSSDSALAMKAGNVLYGYLYSSASEFRVANVTANPIIFYTTNTERARITAGGNLLVGLASDEGARVCANSSSSTVHGLAVRGAADSQGVVQFGVQNRSYFIGGGADYTGLQYNVPSPQNHIWNVGGTERARITSGGALLINRTAALGSELLSVNGTATATDFNSTSDRNKKTNITTIESAVEKVKRLRGVEFDWIADGKHSIGVIAQEVEEVIPSAVQGDEGNKTVSYGNLVGLLIEAIKEQQQVIDQLRSHINPIAE